MSLFTTWVSCIHSPSMIAMLYSMGPSIHMSGECMGREQAVLVSLYGS